MSAQPLEISLAGWRRTVAERYAAVRRAPELGRQGAWFEWQQTRDRLFKFHQQSPLEKEQIPGFLGLNYYDHDPAWRLVARISHDVRPDTFHVELAEDGNFSYTRIAKALFTAGDVEVGLNLYWLESYGGGVFLPFKDATNRFDTFGGGRYLYDTIKGADLGLDDKSIVLDFNYAYNPSCAYHSRWVCPLPPAENTLPFAITAGEKRFLM